MFMRGNVPLTIGSTIVLPTSKGKGQSQRHLRVINWGNIDQAMEGKVHPWRTFITAVAKNGE